MSQLNILAYAPKGQEFAVADAIADLGGFAVAPRTVNVTRDKDRKHVLTEAPAVPGYLFAGVTEAIWHKLNDGILINRKFVRVYIVATILPKVWVQVQQFAAEIEMDYQFRMADVERQQREDAEQAKRNYPYLCPYDVGDKLKILGELANQMAVFERVVRVGGVPMLQAKLTIFGRETTVKIDPAKADKWAAE